MARQLQLGLVLLAATLRPVLGVCWAEGCSVDSADLSRGGGTLARAAAAQLARLRATEENRTAGTGPSDGADVAAVADKSSGSAAGEEKVDSTLIAPKAAADCWSLFTEGEELSKLAVAAQGGEVGFWATGAEGVPEQMLRAEELMGRAMHAARGVFRQETLGSSRAFRLFHHAKWLAERGHTKAAERRFREASHSAGVHRRSVLAQHSLARLGYYLTQWGRRDDALEALRDSRKFSHFDTERDPVAPFLFGALEREVVGDDIDKLREAEELILAATEQPTDELEEQALLRRPRVRARGDLLRHPSRSPCSLASRSTLQRVWARLGTASNQATQRVRYGVQLQDAL